MRVVLVLTVVAGFQRFAVESDAAFIDDRMNAEAKVDLLKKIGAEAASSGCLGP